MRTSTVNSKRVLLEKTELHRLENILTLDVGLHKVFDDMELWLEAVADEVSCRTRRARQTRAYPNPCCSLSTSPFTAHGNNNLPLPSLRIRYLSIHVACCRIAHLSGAAAEYLDKVLREMEECTSILAEDVSSTEVLTYYTLHCLVPPVWNPPIHAT
ncbi:uncharacterized protein C8Q71DRAFT_718780 [Rhodofomes roseus]|uniref:Uncharacterized protein n=1 Tax=Rhodofomes roseus TaxID=34475 RepID=A0ABQ8JXW6_9APHY|nr:uncharacterized protein C8Q71DRAFT_718780 [Rhodofomes roseus]KAH9829054.1 hypothetical protein C8Q71DRAFT_718780 [Rhodofomes roseus]